MPNEFFGENLQKGLKQKKKEHHHRILHTRKCLGSKFQLKLTNLSFWTKLTRKGYSQSKKEKNENHRRILHIRKLVSRFQVSASTNNFDFFKQICHKKKTSL